MDTVEHRMRSSVLIVGASAGGLTVADALRRSGHSGPLTLLDADPHPPYDRPPLAKQFLTGEWDAGHLALRTPEALEALEADVRLGEHALALDVPARTVTIESGTCRADRIVIATGLEPRRLPGSDASGAHVLRTLEDAAILRKEITERSRVVVVGDGVLGSEIAATCAPRARDVKLVGSEHGPMHGALGGLGSRVLAALHEAAGVEIIRGRRAVRIVAADGRATGIVLADGTVLDADVIVSAIGSVPRTRWLEDSGLVLDDGIVCDRRCRAADGIWAVGDVARWGAGGDVGTQRLENRTNAAEMGVFVARDILGRDADYVPTPYFWTDHYGSRIQVYGSMADAHEIEVVEGGVGSGRFVAVARDGDDVIGVLGWNMPRQARSRSREIRPTQVAPAASGTAA